MSFYAHHHTIEGMNKVDEDKGHGVKRGNLLLYCLLIPANCNIDDSTRIRGEVMLLEKRQNFIRIAPNKHFVLGLEIRFYYSVPPVNRSHMSPHKLHTLIAHKLLQESGPTRIMDYMCEKVTSCFNH